MRKLVVILCIAALVVCAAGAAYCADKPAQKAAVKAPATSAPAAAGATTPAPRPAGPMGGGFSFLMGTISKIDTSMPGSVKIEMINDVDGKGRIFELGPASNIIKVIDVADLKPGDKARVMLRKVEDKDIAISVITGKMIEMPRPAPAAQKPSSAGAPAMPAPAKETQQ